MAVLPTAVVKMVDQVRPGPLELRGHRTRIADDPPICLTGDNHRHPLIGITIDGKFSSYLMLSLFESCLNRHFRKTMSNDFVSTFDEEVEEPEEEVEEVDLEELDPEERRQILRQQRYEQRVAYRARLRAMRKAQNALDREANRQARIDARAERRQL